MAIGDAIKYGVLRTRDLVELYFGARMVVSLVEKSPTIAVGTTAVVLQQDPRRIRYELVLTSSFNGALSVLVGSPASFEAGTAALYRAVTNGQIVIERDFLTDMEGVCLPVAIQPTAAEGSPAIASTRETFLTPAPVDEFP